MKATESRAAMRIAGSPAADSLAAYCEGVNAAMSQTKVLPPEFWLIGHEFEPLQVAELSGGPLAWWLSLNFDDEVLATKIAGKLDPSVLSELFPEAPETILPGEVGSPHRIIESAVLGLRPP